jgi:hypothetical protein
MTFMSNEQKTSEQLAAELAGLHRRVAELEAAYRKCEAQYNTAESLAKMGW